MADIKIARELALALPEVQELPHHEISSFRVNNRIFATVPDDGHLHVMLEPDQIRSVVAELDGCEEKWWGKTLAAVKVELHKVDRGTLGRLLVDAWRRRAPPRLLD